ncbi:uncharacterized protein PHALS_08040 [Plasmopara halstedii]|uniref:Uncharacterized protein n=1 Tax=Plasmopara halstedii TaxID=4781 RepID=A0A0P1B660_PLAHL|nr:uncharacterized protein PHALS_08040 [Plasmopara halstedii]CEG50321.1 hypothetical protein PHALS_08040 [Plasmopara halstedii]|eukprot:XP_024586690.1 hypothetical protein PHALS_08040 [Plasmopara halstedii]
MARSEETVRSKFSVILASIHIYSVTGTRRHSHKLLNGECSTIINCTICFSPSLELLALSSTTSTITSSLPFSWLSNSTIFLLLQAFLRPRFITTGVGSEQDLDL